MLEAEVLEQNKKLSELEHKLTKQEKILVLEKAKKDRLGIELSSRQEALAALQTRQETAMSSRHKLETELENSRSTIPAAVPAAGDASPKPGAHASPGGGQRSTSRGSPQPGTRPGGSHRIRHQKKVAIALLIPCALMKSSHALLKPLPRGPGYPAHPRSRRHTQWQPMLTAVISGTWRPHPPPPSAAATVAAAIRRRPATLFASGAMSIASTGPRKPLNGPPPPRRRRTTIFPCSSSTTCFCPRI